jgi:hypothetical protein
MEPEGSLPRSEGFATRSYQEPNQSRPRITPSYLLKILINFIRTSMRKSSKWHLSLKFLHQNPVRTSPFPHTCHIPRPSQLFWVRRKERAIPHYKNLIQSPVTSSLLGPKYLPQHRIREHCSWAYVRPSLRETKCHTHIKQEEKL